MNILVSLIAVVLSFSSAIGPKAKAPPAAVVEASNQAEAEADVNDLAGYYPPPADYCESQDFESRITAHQREILEPTSSRLKGIDQARLCPSE